MKRRIFATIAIALAAARLSAATPPGKDTISINACQGTAFPGGWIDASAADADSTFHRTLVGDVPASAWFSFNPGGAFGSAKYEGKVAVAWDAKRQRAASGQSVRVTVDHKGSISNYDYDLNNKNTTEYSPAYERMWISMKMGTKPVDVTLEVTGIPYAVYTAVIYLSGPQIKTASNIKGARDETGRMFLPVSVNGVKYTWDASAGRTAAGTSFWGDCLTCADGPAYGLNALRVENLSGDALTLAYTSHRAGIAAVQIVDEDGGHDYGDDEAEPSPPEADAISFNVCQGADEPGHVDAASGAWLPTPAGDVPAAAWNDLDADNDAVKGATLANWWDAASRSARGDGTATVTFSGDVANNGTDDANAYSPRYLRSWLAKKSGDVCDAELAFEGIPFAKYFVYVHASGVKNADRTAASGGAAFDAVRVQDAVWARWDDASGAAVFEPAQRAEWGDSKYAQTDGSALGKNVLKIGPVFGGSFKVYSRSRYAGIAAVQIVDASGAGAAAGAASGDAEADVAEGETALVAGWDAAIASLTKTGAGELAVSGDLRFPVDLREGGVRLFGEAVDAAVSARAGTSVTLVETPGCDGVIRARIAGSPTVAVVRIDGSAVPAAEVSVEADGDLRTYRFAPSVSGGAARWDFTFDGTLANAGFAGDAFGRADGDGYGADEDIYFDGGKFKAVRASAAPLTKSCYHRYPESWTGVVKGRLSRNENEILASFGRVYQGAGALAVASGEKRANGEIGARGGRDALQRVRMVGRFR